MSNDKPLGVYALQNLQQLSKLLFYPSDRSLLDNDKPLCVYALF
ncbi:hypothetical protein [Nostoc sp. CCY 9925]